MLKYIMGYCNVKICYLRMYCKFCDVSLDLSSLPYIFFVIVKQYQFITYAQYMYILLLFQTTGFCYAFVRTLTIMSATSL